MDALLDDDDSYNVQVGSRLRAIRKQKRLSLQEVEIQSEYAFKASVLGAYERGERSLSLPRLDRLAQFYRVPVDQLLPRAENDPGGEADATVVRPKLAIDIGHLMQLSGTPFEMLTRYLRMIQIQRQDFNGRVLTVRNDDKRAIAAILDIPLDQVTLRLEALDLVFRPQ